jgi:hypothetical protein
MSSSLFESLFGPALPGATSSPQVPDIGKSSVGCCTRPIGFNPLACTFSSDPRAIGDGCRQMQQTELYEHVQFQREGATSTSRHPHGTDDRNTGFRRHRLRQRVRWRGLRPKICATESGPCLKEGSGLRACRRVFSGSKGRRECIPVKVGDLR